MGFPVGRDVTGAFAVIIDPDNGESDQEVAFEAPLSERWTAVGLIGNSDRDDNIYAEAVPSMTSVMASALKRSTKTPTMVTAFWASP